MRLHPPFIISSRLLPALRIGDAVLSLEDWGHANGREGRDVATFILDLPGGTEYRDDQLQSGRQGFRGCVEMFETFLCFLESGAEHYDYVQRVGRDDDPFPFPNHVLAWASDNKDEITVVRVDLLLDPERDEPNEALITE